jgi:hypothetical protein
MGNKHSGRPSAKIEFARTEKRAEAINLSWDKVVEFLKDENIPTKDKMDVASKIAIKTMPSVVNGGENGEPVTVNLVNFADAIKSISQ